MQASHLPSLIPRPPFRSSLSGPVSWRRCWRSGQKYGLCVMETDGLVAVCVCVLGGGLFGSFEVCVHYLLKRKGKGLGLDCTTYGGVGGRVR